MKMHVLDQSVTNSTDQLDQIPSDMSHSYCVTTAAQLLVSIVETACEHESDLDLMRLVNFMDLYRVYLTDAQSARNKTTALDIGNESSSALADGHAAHVPIVEFEQFIGDSRLLSLAAGMASADCGERVAAPAPLRLSANTTLEST